MGRRKKVHVLTQEQIDWRNSILRGKIESIKKVDKLPEVVHTPKEEIPPIITKEDEILKCFFYLNNCVFWVNEYIDGIVDKKRLLETAIAMQGNAKKLELVLRECLRTQQ